VQVTNGKFTIDGKPFVFAGWNMWNVLEGVRTCSMCSASCSPGVSIGLVSCQGAMQRRRTCLAAG
jgi:hypothetical protein